MARKRDIGVYYLLEVKYLRKTTATLKPFYQYTYIVKGLYSSKRDAIVAKKYIRESCVDDISREKKTPQSNIIIQTINVKKCTIYVYDTSKI